MMNIAVLVSGGGTNLQALIDAQNRGEIKNGKIPVLFHQIPMPTLLKEQEIIILKQGLLTARNMMTVVLILLLFVMHCLP